MSRGSRFVLAAVCVLFTWMMLSGWDTDSTQARVGSAAFAAFMLVLAAGLIAPNRLRIAFRVIAGAVALTYAWYFGSEVYALLRGETQPIRIGSPSAVMAGLGFIVFGIPALVFALGGVTVGWVDRLLKRARGQSKATTESGWAPGMVYSVPLADGSLGFAQVIDAMMSNIVYVALFADRISPPSPLPLLERRRVIALCATTGDDLSRAGWLQLGVAAPVVPKDEFSTERFAKDGSVGAKHYDAWVLVDFLSAYHGLEPWNALDEEDYYDRLLAPGVGRPGTACMLTPEERAAYRAQQEAAGDSVS